MKLWDQGEWKQKEKIHKHKQEASTKKCHCHGKKALELIYFALLILHWDFRKIIIKLGFIWPFCPISYLVNSCSCQERGNLQEVIRSDRPLSGTDGQQEIGTSQPAWFLWKLRSTHGQRGFRMSQYSRQPLESKRHTLLLTWRSHCFGCGSYCCCTLVPEKPSQHLLAETARS